MKRNFTLIIVFALVVSTSGFVTATETRTVEKTVENKNYHINCFPSDQSYSVTVEYVKEEPDGLLDGNAEGERAEIIVMNETQTKKYKKSIKDGFSISDFPILGSSKTAPKQVDEYNVNTKIKINKNECLVIDGTGKYSEGIIDSEYMIGSSEFSWEYNYTVKKVIDKTQHEKPSQNKKNLIKSINI